MEGPPVNIETQYLELLRRLVSEGDFRLDRTGVGTRSLFGEVLRQDLSLGLPLLTTKRVPWKLAAKEMLWFLTGGTNIRELVLEGVGIWTDWPLKRYRGETGTEISQDEFETRIKGDAEFAAKWGDLGPVYGKQWRRWLGPDGREHDQIAEVIKRIKSDPANRRLLFTAWNVGELEDMALPPCHMTYQFHVAGGRLNCALFQRSCDIFLGVPFNLFGAALLTHMLAQQTGLQPGNLIWFGGDVHLYVNHLDQAALQLSREPKSLPRLEISRRPDSIDGYDISDFDVQDYNPHAPISAEVAV
ncbi:MAG: thymidylate synthase [Sphingomonadales bacterium]|nr:thymidylate synthase [Sphingomonadales bacterium]